MIPPLNLASDPGIKILMREATVADCIDFADVDPAHEEAITTLFLNTVQDKASFRDSKLWTADDRRLALFWYWIHTEKDTLVPVTYECKCGETHRKVIDYKLFAETYRPIKGKAERDIEFNGEKVTVRPLNGADMETLEMMRVAMDDADGAGARNKKAAMIRLHELMACSTFPSVDGNEKMEQRFFALPIGEFEDLARKVGEALADMEHGMASEYDDGQIHLITPPIDCPDKGKEKATRLRVRFWNSDYIPGL